MQSNQIGFKFLINFDLKKKKEIFIFHFAFSSFKIREEVLEFLLFETLTSTATSELQYCEVCMHKFISA